MILAAAACAPAISPLQSAAGTMPKQTRHIERRLARKSIVCTAVTVSSNAVVKGMDTYHQAYDLMAKDGATYILILRKSDGDFTAVLDHDGRLIDGIIDNSVTPALFPDDCYKFENAD